MTKQKCKHDGGYYTKSKATQYLFYDEKGEPDGGEIYYHKAKSSNARYCRQCDAVVKI